jgi:hypothetical protein
MVGEYVPFYFCPRSVMLYLLNQRNHPGLNYQGGQQPIIHLQADLHQVVNWAQSNGARWAFSDSNAGSRYAQFYNRLADLKEVDWKAVPAQYWSDPATKEGKQAEFLLHEFFPWELVEEIGVINSVIQAQAHQALSGSAGVPPVVVKRNWYY